MKATASVVIDEPYPQDPKEVLAREVHRLEQRDDESLDSFIGRARLVAEMRSAIDKGVALAIIVMYS